MAFKDLNLQIKKYLSNEIVIACFVAIVIIVGGIFMGFYNNRVVITNPDSLAHYTADPGNHLSFFSNWDGPHYLHIAEYGYNFKNLTNFFPLYPILIHIVHFVIPSYLDSALIVSWICFAIASFFYIKIIKKLFSVKDNFEALRGLLLFVLYPTAMFMLTSYTEALFAALALSGLYFMLCKKYYRAAILISLAGATHITGLFMIVLLGCMMIENRRKLREIVSALVISVLGIAAYMAYLWHRFNSPLLFIKSQQSHGWLSGGLTNLYSTVDAWNIIIIILLITSTVYWYKQKNYSFSIYSFLFVLIPLVGKQFGGFNRYSLAAFPLPLMLYAVLRKRQTAYTFALVATTVIWTYFLLQYSGGYVGG